MLNKSNKQKTNDNKSTNSSNTNKKKEQIQFLQEIF